MVVMWQAGDVERWPKHVETTCLGSFTPNSCLRASLGWCWWALEKEEMRLRLAFGAREGQGVVVGWCLKQKQSPSGLHYEQGRGRDERNIYLRQNKMFVSKKKTQREFKKKKHT
jgi:hypothetical protein